MPEILNAMTRTLWISNPCLVKRQNRIIFECVTTVELNIINNSIMAQLIRESTMLWVVFSVFRTETADNNDDNKMTMTTTSTKTRTTSTRTTGNSPILTALGSRDSDLSTALEEDHVDNDDDDDDDDDGDDDDDDDDDEDV